MEERWAIEKLVLKFHSVEEQQQLNLFVLSDPACEISINFSFDLAHSVHSFLRSFGTLLIPLIYFGVIATHFRQLQIFNATGTFPSFFVGLASLLLSPYALVFYSFGFAVKLFPAVAAIQFVSQQIFTAPKPWPTVAEISGVLVTSISATFVLATFFYILYKFVHIVYTTRLVRLLAGYVQPRSAFFSLGIVAVLCIASHSAIAIAFCLTLLLWPSAETLQNKVRGLRFHFHSLLTSRLVSESILVQALNCSNLCCTSGPHVLLVGNLGSRAAGGLANP